MREKKEGREGDEKGRARVAVAATVESIAAHHGKDGSDASRGSLVGGHANDRRRRIFTSPFAL